MRTGIGQRDGIRRGQRGRSERGVLPRRERQYIVAGVDVINTVTFASSPNCVVESAAMLAPVSASVTLLEAAKLADVASTLAICDSLKCSVLLVALNTSTPCVT